MPTSGPLVLCYHAVSDRWEHALTVEAATLERQVRAFVARGFRPARAEEVVAGRAAVLHVTFDDAFRSLLRVLPALEAVGVPVTVFACSGYAEEGRALDIPELEPDVAAHPEELVTMDWEALRALGERGVEIGSHTVTHPHLSSLDDEALARELSESRERIEERLGRPCRYFAYPFGEHDERVRAAVRAVGYEAAFALPGRASPADRFALARVGVYRRDRRVRLRFKASRLGRALAR